MKIKQVAKLFLKKAKKLSGEDFEKFVYEFWKNFKEVY